MIKRATFFAFLILTLFTGGVVFKTFYSPKKMKSIEEILTQDAPMMQSAEDYLNKQMRSGVSKDLWIVDRDNRRLHHHIESPRSILTAVHKGSKMELTEQMINMRCFFQDKVEEESGVFKQQIRHIQSEEGTYRYSDQKFHAHSVFLALHSIEGETLTTILDPQTAYLKGIADEVTLSFSNGSPHFHAEKFKAHIHENPR